MSTKLSEYDYPFPKDLIAQHSASPRDHARMMVLDRKTGAWQHQHVFDLSEFLRPGDVLVFNESKVFKARLRAIKVESRLEVEVFLLRKKEGYWEALLAPGRRIRPGMRLAFGKILSATVVEKREDGVCELVMSADDDEVLAYCQRFGEVPKPPYVEGHIDLKDYQTVYARKIGSVAAPTAGFHFTEDLLSQLKGIGVEVQFITLHVGLGTFQTMKTDIAEEHEMHVEYVEISEKTAQALNQAKQEDRHIIAVGTTVTRALEGAAQKIASSTSSSRNSERSDVISVFQGDVNIFIKPGYQFRVIDGMMTNFHLPRTTLLLLVSALAGREHLLAAYLEAIREQYRFYSFGDAMLIL